MERLILLPSQRGAKDRRLVGGKAASLSELAEITSVAPYFLITTGAYTAFLDVNPTLRTLIKKLDDLSEQWLTWSQNKNKKTSLKTLEKAVTAQAALIRKTIKKSALPPRLIEQVKKNYAKLSKKMGVSTLPVAIRSSGVAEDTADASFAGQYDTFLNQRGVAQVLSSIKAGFASQFTDRVVTYRNQLKLELVQQGKRASGIPSHSQCKLALAVQAMVNSAASGVAFSIEPESASPFFSIETSYGLGEAIVAGKVTPDSYFVDPRTMAIVHRVLGEKAVKTIYSAGSGTRTVKTSPAERRRFAVTDTNVKKIAAEVLKIKRHYATHVDVEFGFDTKGRLFIFQARPETVASHKNTSVVPMKSLIIAEGTKQKTVILAAGKTGSPGVGVGRVLVAKSVEEAKAKLQKGDVLVTERTDPDWNPVLHLPSVVVTNIGGANCHAAIISRERGIPCLVGTGRATQVLAHYVGQEVTVDATNSAIYEQALPLTLVGEDINVKKILARPTKIAIGLIVSNPETARKMHALRHLEQQFLISLLRIEFLLTEIGVHPRLLADYDREVITDNNLRKQVAEKITGFPSGQAYYITKLAEGIAQFAAVFPHSPVTLRTTDFKTNEYGNLIGGDMYERSEANPMMGWRGLIRSLSPDNREVTKWELRAIKKARDMGYQNIQVMFPVVRDPQELTGGPELARLGFKGIFEIMKEVGLKRHKDGFKVGIMVEVPTNAVRIDEFIDAGLDFISFGTNDLTQFSLAVDRDGNDSIQSIPIYKEGNRAVVELVKHVIKRCRARKVKTGICGQAPSNDPQFVKMLADAGVNSIGVMPDRYLPTYKLVKQAEKSSRRK